MVVSTGHHKIIRFKIKPTEQKYLVPNTLRLSVVTLHSFSSSHNHRPSLSLQTWRERVLKLVNKIKINKVFLNLDSIAALMTAAHGKESEWD